MSVLYDAATAWKDLLSVSYEITYGKKGVLYPLTISFEAEQFSHLCGIHHVKDVDLKVPYPKEKFLQMVLNHQYDSVLLEKSIFWKDISGRLEALKKLQSILDSDFILYLFRRNVLPFYSEIDANYLIRNPETNDVVFLFLDGPSQKLFCRSIFTKADRDYSINQKSTAVLKKVKRKEETIQILLDKIKK